MNTERRARNRAEGITKTRKFLLMGCAVAATWLGGCMAIVDADRHGRDTPEYSTDEPTRIRVDNRLLDIALDGGGEATLVDLYGVSVGGLSFGNVAGGELTGFRTLQSVSGSAEVRFDSIGVVIPVCNDASGFCGEARVTVRETTPYAVSIDPHRSNTVTVSVAEVPVATLVDDTTRVRVKNVLTDVEVSIEGRRHARRSRCSRSWRSFGGRTAEPMRSRISL